MANYHNIKVDDTIRYEVTIAGSSKNGEATYIFNPNSSDEQGHRRLGKDYRAFIYNNDSLKQHLENKDSNAVDIERKKAWINLREIKRSAVLSQKGKYTLLIIPLRPGSFVEDFIFTEKKNGGDENILNKQLNFNCVRLTAWAQHVQVEHGTVFRKSKHRNDFYIKIEDGTEENDRHLTMKENRTQNYMIEYDGGNYEGRFEEGKDIRFLESKVRKSSPPTIYTKYIKRLIIKQKDTGYPEVILEFNNIPLMIK